VIVPQIISEILLKCRKRKNHQRKNSGNLIHYVLRSSIIGGKLMSDIWKTFGITIIVIIILISAVLIFTYLSRECNNNLDCNQNEYCSFSNKCIEFPPSNNVISLLPSSIVIAISLIISAYILRKRSNKQQN